MLGLDYIVINIWKKDKERVHKLRLFYSLEIADTHIELGTRQ